jgi:hypothetical protein
LKGGLARKACARALRFTYKITARALSLAFPPRTPSTATHPHSLLYLNTRRQPFILRNVVTGYVRREGRPHGPGSGAFGQSDDGARYIDRADPGANGDTFHHWARRACEAAPVEVVLDGAKGAAGEKVGITIFYPKHLYGKLTLDLPALSVSSYHPTRHGELGLQASAANRRVARAGREAGETRTRALPSLISNAVRRRPWTLGIANTQTPPSSTSCVEGAFDHFNTFGDGFPLKEAERKPAEDDVDGEG